MVQRAGAELVGRPQDAAVVERLVADRPVYVVGSADGRRGGLTEDYLPG